MTFPEELKYTKEHEWVSIKDGIATIGITEHAQSELGEIVYVEIETVGEDVAKDEVFGTVEAVKTTSDLFMPLAGKVIEFNDQLNEEEGDNPGLINEDPYGKGWIIKIEISDESEAAELLSASDYKNLIS
jgi:glycine cleavage system H protein